MPSDPNTAPDRARLITPHQTVTWREDSRRSGIDADDPETAARPNPPRRRLVHWVAQVVWFAIAAAVGHFYGAVPGLACCFCAGIGMLSGWTDPDVVVLPRRLLS